MFKVPFKKSPTPKESTLLVIWLLNYQETHQQTRSPHTFPLEDGLCLAVPCAKSEDSKGVSDKNDSDAADDDHEDGSANSWPKGVARRF